jgi:hypothetical protein
MIAEGARAPGLHRSTPSVALHNVVARASGAIRTDGSRPTARPGNLQVRGACAELPVTTLREAAMLKRALVGAAIGVGFLSAAPAPPAVAQSPPALLGATSRMVHGAAGPFDLPLAMSAGSPTTEPRVGPLHSIVFMFNKPVTGGVAAVFEGTATAGSPTFSGAEMIVPLTGVSDQQYVTVVVANVAASDGGMGGSGSIRLAFLKGDVNQTGVISVADLGLVNAQLAQPVSAANMLKDVNASGTLTLADKGLTNANLTQSLPGPGAGWTTLISRAWTVPAGQEAHLCRGEIAAQDLYIKAFRMPAAAGLAHLAVSISDTAGTLGDFACTLSDGLQGGTYKLIYWGGTGVNDILFPASNGVAVKAGQYVIVNTHVDNTFGVTPLSGTSQLQMTTGTAAQVTVPVEQILVGTFLFSIPPGGIHSALGGCNSANNQTFLAASPSMRKYGTHQTVEIVAGATTTILDRNFDVMQQTSYPMIPAVSVSTGNQIRTTCTWNNPTPSTVTFGDSVQDEMCFTAVYRFPIVPGNQILACTS